jgi:uncharacterized membrane protein YccC
VVQSCNWAGATCAVVAASPLIGKVAQLSYERTLGTLTGGMLGFLVSSSSSSSSKHDTILACELGTCTQHSHSLGQGFCLSAKAAMG